MDISINITSEDSIDDIDASDTECDRIADMLRTMADKVAAYGPSALNEYRDSAGESSAYCTAY